MSNQKEFSKAKYDYLKALYDEENERQKTLEGKCFTVISNSGIFITLIGLLITILFSQKDLIPLEFKLLLLIVVAIIIVSYVYSMYHASKVLNPTPYKYSRGDPNTVNGQTDEVKFYDEVNADFIYSIDRNGAINNLKADHLKQARKGFILGIFITMALILSLIVFAIYFLKPDNKVQIIKIKDFEFEKTIEKLNSKLDSINNTLKTKKKSLSKIKIRPINSYKIVNN